MLVPSIFEDNFVDNFFDDMFRFPFSTVQKSKVQGMNVDVQVFDDRYEMDLELPGYTKEAIQADLKDGYLTISANHTENKDKKDSDGKYIRKERYYGQCQRSFFVGKEVTEEDIKANFKDGILRLTIPKKEEKPAVEERKFITIE